MLTRGSFRVLDDAVIPAFRPITEACQAHGAVMIQQIYHVGQHGDGDNSYEPSWSPSGLPSYHDSDGSHAMSEAGSLVLATTNLAETSLQEGLAGSPRELHTIGDCVAPRLAPHAFYEGRKLALSL